MAVPKILVIPGALRAKSHVARLAALAAKQLTLADTDVTRISLADYPLPIYDAGDAAESAPPNNAVMLKRLRLRPREEPGEAGEDVVEPGRVAPGADHVENA